MLCNLRTISRNFKLLLYVNIVTSYGCLATFLKAANFSKESHSIFKASELYSCPFFSFCTSIILVYQKIDILMVTLIYTFCSDPFPGLSFPFWISLSEVLYCVSLDICSKVKDEQYKTSSILNNRSPHIWVFKYNNTIILTLFNREYSFSKDQPMSMVVNFIQSYPPSNVCLLAIHLI